MPPPLPTMSYLTDIYFACGAVRVVPALLEKFQVRRPLVVTDAGIVKAGLLGRLAIDDAVVFAEVQTNPTEASALRAVEVYREQECDGIVALGGGAPIDLAKIVALLVKHALPVEQYAILRGGVGRITGDMPPVIAIPTTAGSGSEVGRAALLILARGEKLGFLSPHLIPKAAVCDPELTVSLPALLTAATGMDAISHCVEEICSPRVNPVAEAIAFEAFARGFSNIEIATRDGGNLAARSEMMLCSLEAGLAFQKGLGAVHSLSHPLGGLPGKLLHHGTLNAIFLPHVLRFNAGFCGDKSRRMAQRIGMGEWELAEVFAALNQQLGLPTSLSAMGVTAADLQGLAEKAAGDHCSPTNPRALTVEDCARLYREAL